MLEKIISDMQQGFLSGRCMLSDVIDIDWNAMTVSLKDARGVMLLFDFKAAFPSIAHSFLKDSLKSLGLPPHAISLVEALYDQNKCNISFQGASTRDSVWNAGYGQAALYRRCFLQR